MTRLAVMLRSNKSIGDGNSSGKEFYDHNSSKMTKKNERKSMTTTTTTTNMSNGNSNGYSTIKEKEEHNDTRNDDEDSDFSYVADGTTNDNDVEEGKLFGKQKQQFPVIVTTTFFPTALYDEEERSYGEYCECNNSKNITTTTTTAMISNSEHYTDTRNDDDNNESSDYSYVGFFPRIVTLEESSALLANSTLTSNYYSHTDNIYEESMSSSEEFCFTTLMAMLGMLSVGLLFGAYISNYINAEVVRF